MSELKLPIPDKPADIHVRCTECGSVYAIKRIVDAVESPISYCIYCGSGDTKTGIEDGDYWESLAVDVGLPSTAQGVNALKLLFNTWSPGEGDPYRFVDYARMRVSEATEETS